MHREFARAQQREQARARLNGTDSEDDSDEDPSYISQLRKKLPDSEGEKFNIAVGVVIVVNALVLGLETDLGQASFIVCEHFFAIFFTLEMTLRICQLGLSGYIWRGSNSFDCLLVCTGDFDLWVSPLLSIVGVKTGKGSVAQGMKLLRMFRVCRIVRLFKVFRELQIIMEAFVKALNTVMWVGLLTVILNYICAVFLTQTIGHNAEMWGPDAHSITEWFGSIGNSMRTLFIILTLAEWDLIALTVSEKVNGLVVFLLAIAYITLTAFTMVSLITGIISEELCGAQKDDEDHKLAMVEQGKIELAAEVKVLLERLDEDGSGTLSEEEITNALNDEEFDMLGRLQALSVRMEVDEFLSMISRLRTASASGEISIDAVSTSLQHMHGAATASAVWEVRIEAHTLQTGVQGVKGSTESLKQNLDNLQDRMSKTLPCTSDSIDKAACRLGSVEEKAQHEQSLIENRLDKVMTRLDGMDDRLKNDGYLAYDKLDEKVNSLEEIVHAMCSHMLNGKNGDVAQCRFPPL